MDRTGVILPTARPESPAWSVLGLPLVGWALRNLLRQIPAQRIVAINPHGSDHDFLAARGVRIVDQPPVSDHTTLEASPLRPFAVGGSSPFESFEIQAAADVEIAEAIARGLPSSHPCIQGAMALRIAGGVKVRAVVCDVDGTLTDGRLLMLPDGGCSRAFHSHDGMATHLLREAGIQVAWLTATRDGASTQARAAMLRLDPDLIDVGTGDKGARLEALCERMQIPPGKVAYIGDDVNDLPAFERAGVAVCPGDARPEVRAVADLVLETHGGFGALRELASILLDA
jgi:3-deoxy-D-manno-octulosonate 8-phosphate phosphatase (KDO 8-P phosphatase)